MCYPLPRSVSMNSFFLQFLPMYSLHLQIFKYNYSVSKHYLGYKDIRKFIPFGRSMLLERRKVKVSST